MSFIIGIEWLATLIMMLLSIIRSLNIGYQRETYILGIYMQIPLICNGVRLGDTRLILMNTFYFINGIIAVYCWSLSSNKLSEKPLNKLSEQKSEKQKLEKQKPLIAEMLACVPREMRHDLLKWCNEMRELLFRDEMDVYLTDEQMSGKYVEQYVIDRMVSSIPGDNLTKYVFLQNFLWDKSEMFPHVDNLEYSKILDSLYDSKWENEYNDNPDNPESLVKITINNLRTIYARTFFSTDWVPEAINFKPIYNSWLSGHVVNAVDEVYHPTTMKILDIMSCYFAINDAAILITKEQYEDILSIK